MSKTFRKIDIIEEAGIQWKPPINLESTFLDISSDRLQHDVMAYQDDAIDITWFKKQSDFIQSLSDREKFILRTYSRNGDEVVNSLMRIKDANKLIKKLMSIVEKLKTPNMLGKPRVNIFNPTDLKTITTKNVIEIATRYSNELFEIFKKAPPVETYLRTFRGISPETGKDPVIYPLVGITSTSYNSDNAKDFAEEYDNDPELYATIKKQRESVGKEMLKNCCIFDMVLRPGVRAIWLEPISEFGTEQEIILLPTIIQASYSHPKQKILYSPDKKITEFQTYDVVVTPIVGKTFSMKGGKTKRSKRRYRKTYRK